MKDNKSYEESLAELQAIVADLEDGQINIDELTSKLKRATVLLKFCRSRLTATEKDVADLLKELEEGAGE